jgi:CRP/FNR family transcriptional regulator, cyclic AMP receptor protein
MMIEQMADIVQIIQRIPWFVDLDQVQQWRLAQIARIRNLHEGDTLFTEGDSDSCLYILLNGEVVMENHVPTFGSIEIYTAAPLDIIGWSAMTPMVRQRTATARATQAGRVLCFDSELLLQLCNEDHDMGYIIMRRISNLVASRLLTTRLELFEIISKDRAARDRT